MLDPTETNQEKYLNASSEMLDQLGVYQHHDAIAGTAKQAVADDYAKRLSKAISQNNEDLYSKLIAKQVTHLTDGVVTSSEWQMCDKSNATYLDCPVS
jgi:oligoribonuclease NrnB/cAMP/cGMP phosphodiesterase (DHH superfamily)